jgi:hypothetical protein
MVLDGLEYSPVISTQGQCRLASAIHAKGQEFSDDAAELRKRLRSPRGARTFGCGSYQAFPQVVCHER